MKTLIVGLGNPGNRYRHTFHNVGAMFIDALATRFGADRFRLHASRTFRYASAANVMLIQPTVYMNESGVAVVRALSFFKAKPKELLVAHDDSDIKLGAYKHSLGRGAAGHKGVLSIIGALHTNAFYRLRIGVRTRSGKAGRFVLARIRPKDMNTLQSVFQEITENVIVNEYVRLGVRATLVSGRSTPPNPASCAMASRRARI